MLEINGFAALALADFSSEFSKREAAGVIVRSFAQCTDDNIWVFAHLLDGVRDAAADPKSVASLHRHPRLLEALARRLNNDGFVATRMVVERLLTATQRLDRASDWYRQQAHNAHVRMMASFAWGLVSEMDGKGLWKDDGSLQRLGELHALVIQSVDLAHHVRDADELLAYISGEALRLEGRTAAETVLGFRSWKPWYSF
jgi:hypothetical protein